MVTITTMKKNENFVYIGMEYKVHSVLPVHLFLETALYLLYISFISIAKSSYNKNSTFANFFFSVIKVIKFYTIST